MPLSVAGALLLAWMAYGCFKDAMTQPPEIDDTDVNPPYQRSSDFWQAYRFQIRLIYPIGQG